MVNYSTPIDLTFAALADSTRRRMVEHLATGEALTVTTLAQPFAMSLPAVLKHLKVLADAGIVVREKRGRTVYCRLQAEPMRQAIEWLERYQRFWTERLDALAAFVEEDSCPPAPTSPASPSSAASAPPPRRSSKRGSSPKR